MLAQPVKPVIIVRTGISWLKLVSACSKTSFACRDGVLASLNRAASYVFLVTRFSAKG